MMEIVSWGEVVVWYGMVRYGMELKLMMISM